MIETLLGIALLFAAASQFVDAAKAKAWLAAFREKYPAVQFRHVIAAGMVALALLLLLGGRGSRTPTPAPTPPDSPISLDGLWAAHPEAAADTARVEALFDEIASDVEWDADQAEPDITTGIAFDELRTRAFDMRLKGDSIGDRHPRVRAEIKRYLDSAAGTSGGPLTPEEKAKWIAAFRTVAREAGRYVK
jgi:hypothetical protein